MWIYFKMRVKRILFGAVQIERGAELAKMHEFFKDVENHLSMWQIQSHWLSVCLLSSWRTDSSTNLFVVYRQRLHWETVQTAIISCLVCTQTGSWFCEGCNQMPLEQDRRWNSNGARKAAEKKVGTTGTQLHSETQKYQMLGGPLLKTWVSCR